jgi:hypothetical protein
VRLPVLTYPILLFDEPFRRSATQAQPTKKEAERESR